MEALSILIIIFLVFFSGCIHTPENTIYQTQTNPLVFTTNTNLMVFVAHEDDEAIGAATIMKRAIENDGEVTLVMTTDGAPREFGHGDFEAEIRRDETIRAMSLIGVPEENIIFLGYDDRGFIYDIDVDQEIERIANIITEVNPTHIFLHAYEGGHIDHDATHYLAIKALESTDLNPEIYEFPEYNAYAWGAPIPEDADRVDNEEYPIIEIDLTEEEKTLKKEVLKQYISQHPVKSNLMREDPEKGLEIMHALIDVDGENIKAEDILEGDDHYLMIGQIEWSSSHASLSGFGEEIFNNSPKLRNKVDFLLDNFDMYTPPIHGCELLPKDEWGYILDYDIMTACIQDLFEPCTEVEIESLGGIEYCELDKEISRNRSLTNIQSIMEMYENLYPEGVPDNVRQNLRFGNYYEKINKDVDFFGGTIPIKPASKISIVIDIANYLNEDLTNVTASVIVDGYQDSLPTIRKSSDLFGISSKNIKQEQFNIDIALTSVKYLYGLTIRVEGFDPSGNIYTDSIHFGLDLDQEEHDIGIAEIRKDTRATGTRIDPSTGENVWILEEGLMIGVINMGTQETEYILTVANDELGINYVYNERCMNNNCTTPRVMVESINGAYIPLDLDIANPGEYSFTITLFTDGNIVDEKTIIIYVKENGEYDIGERKDYREPELLHLYPPQDKPEVRIEDCQDDDYLVCFFYWPDTYRALPEYDYSVAPHERPPVLGYESGNEELEPVLEWDTYRQAIGE